MLNSPSPFLTHRYGAIRGGYQHFGAQGGQDSGFPSPRGALGYPFPPMHQNSYSGYHLGSYPPPCSSPPKDGKLTYRCLGALPIAPLARPWRPITIISTLIADHMSLTFCGPKLINFNWPRLKHKRLQFRFPQVASTAALLPPQRVELDWAFLWNAKLKATAICWWFLCCRQTCDVNKLH